MTETTQTKSGLSGQVLSAKMDKTISVKVERVVPHPLYGKYIRRTNKVLAHDPSNLSKQGDLVEIVACRPISSRKAWVVKRVIISS
jgi:small subunit ribosomal protein S17